MIMEREREREREREAGNSNAGRSPSWVGCVASAVVRSVLYIALAVSQV